MGSKSSARSGTQSVERAIALLREVLARAHFGWQLGDIAARCQLSRSTTHRILAHLVRQGLVVQRPADRHYLPGPCLFELGLALPEYGDLQYVARGRLTALANCSGGVAFLYFRSGDDFVCAVRAGKTETKALTIVPGTRRPLIMSAGGAAILRALPAEEARAIIRRNLEQPGGPCATQGYHCSALSDARRRARRRCRLLSTLGERLRLPGTGREWRALRFNHPFRTRAEISSVAIGGYASLSQDHRRRSSVKALTAPEVESGSSHYRRRRWAARTRSLRSDRPLLGRDHRRIARQIIAHPEKRHAFDDRQRIAVAIVPPAVRPCPA